jgi:phosphopantetheinyl transferase (holo-ACP synthase)
MNLLAQQMQWKIKLWPAAAQTMPACLIVAISHPNTYAIARVVYISDECVFEAFCRSCTGMDR